ncbi:hypothetical protein M3Y99_00996700 [Aphelenchoides fujianensis]|nr:hypothetical protein M3Y99_00996700 [Aphelenchoides fujianensis]
MMAEAEEEDVRLSSDESDESDAEDEEDGGGHAAEFVEDLVDPAEFGNDLVPVPPPFRHRFERLLAMHPLFVRVAACTVRFPLTFAEHSRQLGFEPFPLHARRLFWFCGPQHWFTPNIFSYLNQIRQQQGWGALFTGYDTTMTSMLVANIADVQVTRLLQREWPEVGGPPPRHELIHFNHFASPTNGNVSEHLRFLVRKSVHACITQAVVHPLRVVFVREVAQQLSGECKYAGTPFMKVMQLAEEEGLAGLFAGFVPTLLQRLLFLWGTITTHYLLNRAFAELRAAPHWRYVCEFLSACGFQVFTYAVYPLRRCFPLMAANKSGLRFVSPPHVPAFENWWDVRRYLRGRDPFHGLGAFARPHLGPHRHGADGQTYAITNFDL